jgi:tRNA G18 (ribose-2'-O)-methylase SpoU
MQIVVIAHNIRSTHNIGSILRTCDGLGVAKVFCTGYTPYPTLPNDERLPHMREKLTQQIHKTALGAEKTVSVRQSYELGPVLTELKAGGYQLIALEQSDTAVMLQDFKPSGGRVALLLGEEVHGIPADLLKRFDTIIEIPMRGTKESFNVSVAAGIALYALSLNS